MRSGLGIDSHRFAAGRRLVLGGVEIPHDRGLDGHSDADVLAHAITDVAADSAAHEPSFNQTLTTVNDSAVRLGVIDGDFHWHKHDVEDECFIVLEGELLLDIEGKGTVTLTKHLGYTVPKGVVHRTRAAERTVVLMIEQVGVVPTGD